MSPKGERGRRTAALTGLVGATVVVVAIKGAGGGSRTVDVGAGPGGAAGGSVSPSSTAPTSTPSGAAPSGAAPSSTTPSPSSTASAPAEQKLVGSPESFPFGTIQVEVIMRGGKIVNVITLQSPTYAYSAQVASFSLPRLRQEVLQAQSARIDVVSGASYDSQAYALSVQSALDKGRS